MLPFCNAPAMNVHRPAHLGRLKNRFGPLPCAAVG